MEIVCKASSPDGLLSSLAPKAETAVYFLDIQLHSDIDGIELASMIRQNDPRAFIIFTTTHSETAMTTFRYQVEPLDFLIKDDPQYAVQIHHRLKNVVEKAASLPLTSASISTCPIRIFSFRSAKSSASSPWRRTASRSTP